jgi:hypothetical protein
MCDGAGFQPEPRSAGVGGIALTLEESARNQPPQNPGDRTRVQSDDIGQLAGRQIGELADDTQNKTLRSSDAELTFHSLGHALQAMFD